jgi:hypothetical protein
VPIVEHDDVVEQFTADGADEPFRHPVLPRAAAAGAGRFDAHGPEYPRHLPGENRVAVEDQVPRGTVVRERFPQLLGDPPCRRMLGDVPVDDVASPVLDHEQHVQQAKARRGHGEEVHRGDDLAMPQVSASDG